MIPYMNAMAIAVGPGVKTYAEFERHIPTLTVAGDPLFWGSGLGTKSYKGVVTVGAESGSLYGSSWGSRFSTVSNLSRAVQHGLPDYPMLAALLGTKIYISARYLGNGYSTSSYTRNNYTSFSDTAWYAHVLEFILYYDPVRGPMKIDPETSTGPVPCDWTPNPLAEFNAYVAAQATGGVQAWGGSLGSIAAGAYRITTEPTVPGYAPLVGSPWGPLSANGISASYSYWPRVIQHAMPSEAVFNAVKAASGQVLIRVEDGGIASPPYDAYTRNGFTSGATGATSTYIRRITELDAFIPGEGPVKMYPKLGLGPVPLW